MSGWVISYVAIAVAGIAVLGIFGLRVFLVVRELMREVRRAGKRLGEVSARLEAATAEMRPPAAAPKPAEISEDGAALAERALSARRQRERIGSGR